MKKWGDEEEQSGVPKDADELVAMEVSCSAVFADVYGPVSSTVSVY